jgi:hypothetical protein
LYQQLKPFGVEIKMLVPRILARARLRYDIAIGQIRETLKSADRVQEVQFPTSSPPIVATNIANRDQGKKGGRPFIVCIQWRDSRCTMVLTVCGSD